MWLIWLDVLANAVLALVCVWAVMTPRVNDGIIGKLIFITLCFASISNAAWAMSNVADVDRNEVISNAMVALAAVRCYWMKSHRPRFKRWVHRKCKHGL